MGTDAAYEVWADIRPRSPANFLWIFVTGEPDPNLMDQVAEITFEGDCLEWAIVPLWSPKRHHKLGVRSGS